MKKLVMISALFIAFGASVSFASDDGDLQDIKTCLKHWGKHPFKAADPEYRTIATKVKVLGIGGAIEDDKTTSEPELILVKPAVTVLSKARLELGNPNGWYCLKANVSVLGKSEIDLHCKAKMASSSDGVDVLGASDKEGSVDVLGTTRVKRFGCSDSPTSSD